MEHYGKWAFLSRNIVGEMWVWQDVTLLPKYSIYEQNDMTHPAVSFFHPEKIIAH